MNGHLELNSKSQLSNSPNTLWNSFGHALAGIGDETAFSYVPLLTISPKRLSHACTHSANPMALPSVPPTSYDRYKPSNWNSDQSPISNSPNKHGMDRDRLGRRDMRSHVPLLTRPLKRLTHVCPHPSFRIPPQRPVAATNPNWNNSNGSQILSEKSHAALISAILPRSPPPASPGLPPASPRVPPPLPTSPPPPRTPPPTRKKTRPPPTIEPWIPPPGPRPPPSPRKPRCAPHRRASAQSRGSPGLT